MPKWIQLAVLLVGQRDAQSGTPTKAASSPAGAFHTPRCVGARKDARYRAARHELFELVVAQRVGFLRRGKKSAA